MKGSSDWCRAWLGEDNLNFIFSCLLQLTVLSFYIFEISVLYVVVLPFLLSHFCGYECFCMSFIS